MSFASELIEARGAGRDGRPRVLFCCRALAVLASLALAGCGRDAPALPAPPARVDAKDALSLLQSSPLVAKPAAGSRPWIAHLATVDLDADRRIDVVACEAQENRILWYRQTAPRQFAEVELARGIPAPVHVDAVDFDRDGDLDLLVASLGQIFPNNDRIGSVIILENDGRQNFTRRNIAERVARVSDVRAGDFNGDGRLDLAVAQFGYDQGEVQWMENLGGGRFAAHPLLNLSGAIHVVVADFNGDSHADIATIVSQQWEEVHLFTNDGRGNFKGRVLWGSTNEDFASSGLALCDLNGDGRPDLLFSNGDGFGPTPQPGPRPWHGVQWLENKGGGNFAFHRIGDLAGAYSPIEVDLDGDGVRDVVAVSAFNAWENPAAVALMWFRHDGKGAFAPHVLAREPTHLLATAVADLDGDGRPVLVTGGFHAYPPYDRVSGLLLWRKTAP